VPKAKDKWYFFAMAEPNDQNKQFLGTPTSINIEKVGLNGKSIKITSCTMAEETDACFIKNSDFDYQTEKLRLTIECREQCQFNLFTSIDYSYPLDLNKPFQLDFENTAYSKIFTLNTEGTDFFELRILLIPRGFIKYGEPIVLMANFGSEVPTRNKHDLQAIHTWDDGQGIFIRKSEMKDRVLTILVEGPEKNVLILSAKVWMRE
jgi:hypothetical protein